MVGRVCIYFSFTNLSYKRLKQLTLIFFVRTNTSCYRCFSNVDAVPTIERQQCMTQLFCFQRSVTVRMFPLQPLDTTLLYNTVLVSNFNVD